LRLFTSLLVLCGASWAAAQMSDVEKKGLEQVLYLGNMTLRDLEFERKPFSDKYRFSIVNLAIDKPVEAADQIMKLHSDGSNLGPGPLLSLIRREVYKDPAQPKYVASTVAVQMPETVPVAYREVLSQIATGIAMANDRLRQATKALSADEQRLLIESLAQWANEEPSIKFDFIKTKQLPQAEILRLLGKVDLAEVRMAGEQLATWSTQGLAKLRAIAWENPFYDRLKLNISGVSIVFAGHSNDEHFDSDAMLTIDLGGNDRYIGRHGAGAGYCSVVMDLAGNDRYETGDLNLGVGVLGAGLVYDMAGDDVIGCGSVSVGVGLAGVGVFYNEGGRDTYRSATLTQGYGLFGIGLCIDTTGDDLYDAKLNAQGASRTQGVGWLIDRAGGDVYKAGGLILNSPLFKDVYYSNAQGYSSGYREDTGGISGGVGLLTDIAGDDAYVSETYAQAASYWFALGTLYDGGGHDTYTGYHYVQASAMHMCAAYLFDLAGDDGYMVKYGAAHAIGHDYGVAFLLDRQGSDIYAARDSRPGLGNANGLGIFIDSSGEDRYWGPPGSGNPARGSGSLGVFADLSGADKYGEGLAAGHGAVREGWAVALDLEPKEEPGVDSGPTPTRQSPVPGSMARPTDAELEKIYAKATQWAVGTAQQEVADNLDKLVAIGEPALTWMIEKKLATASRLEQRAFVHVVGALGAPAKALIAPKVASANVDEARVALNIAIEADVKDASPFLAAAFQKPPLQRLAARAAGVLHSAQSATDLMGLAASEDRLVALNALLALAELRDKSSIGTGQAMLSSQDVTLRKAAISLVAKFPEDAVIIGKRMLTSGDERSARTGLELLAAVGDVSALEAAGKALDDPRAGVRIQALLALNGRSPDKFKQRILALRNDNNSLVRSVALGIDPGR
jgi:hypothetical protein